MSPPLDARCLLRESIPIAAILAVWTVLSAVGVVPWLTVGLRVAGLVVAGLYVLHRGRQLADQVTVAPLDAADPIDPVVAVRTHKQVLLAAGAWVLAGIGLALLTALVGLFFYRFDEAIAEPLGFFLSATGVTTVLLYAVVVSRSRLDAQHRGDEGTDLQSTSE